MVVIGKLISVSTDIKPGGTIDFQLCGYGSQFPRAIASGNQLGSICAPQSLRVATDPADESFTVNLIGNDLISPAGTYYVATIRNLNEDIVQCNAYVFLDSHGNYDLDFETPIDPTQPALPLPPFVGSWLINVTATSPTTTLPGNKGMAFYVLLDMDIATLQIANGTPGMLYTLVLQQDGTGNRTAGRPLMTNAADLNPAPNGVTTQTFLCFDSTHLLAIAPATYS